MARGLDLSAASEAAWILAAQARDQAAFELVKRRQGWARSLLRRMTANVAEAGRPGAGGFCEGLGPTESLETPAAFPGWFRRIAVTTFLMEKRRRRRLKRLPRRPPSPPRKAPPEPGRGEN